MKYTIGNKKSYTKQHIRDYIRVTLDSLPEQKFIYTDTSIYNFATELIKKHPKYDGFLDYSKNVHLRVVRDNQEGAKGYGNYKIFNFLYTDRNGDKKSWAFSTNKIIKNL